MTARDVTGFCAFSPPGNRAIFSTFLVRLLKNYSGSLEKKEKTSTGEKSSEDGAPKLQMSVPSLGRRPPKEPTILKGLWIENHCGKSKSLPR